jgi:hypothetical protein
VHREYAIAVEVAQLRLAQEQRIGSSRSKPGTCGAGACTVVNGPHANAIR